MDALSIIGLLGTVASVFLGALLMRAVAAKRRVEERFRSVLDLEAEKARVLAEISHSRRRSLQDLELFADDRRSAEAETARLTASLAALRAEHTALKEESVQRACGSQWQVNESKAEGTE